MRKCKNIQKNIIKMHAMSKNGENEKKLKKELIISEFVI